MMEVSGAGLVRLLQLASPFLPVGGYSYSQGLEWAVEAGIAPDAAGAQRWIGDALNYSVGRFEAPLFVRLYQAWAEGRPDSAAKWNGFFRAARETAEFRAETEQMGYSLVRLLQDLGGFHEAELANLAALEPITFPAAFSFAAWRWDVPLAAALHAYLWAWTENQVSAAVKAIPLGQAAGQRVLSALGALLPDVAEAALILPDEALSNFTPGLAVASSLHETQYSRLFRS